MASRIIDVDYYAGGDRKVVTSVDVYKSIRALQLEGVTSQRATAKILGISRNTVKKYWMGDAVPWDRKAYQREASVITPEVMNYRNLENRINVAALIGELQGGSWMHGGKHFLLTLKTSVDITLSSFDRTMPQNLFNFVNVTASIP